MLLCEYTLVLVLVIEVAHASSHLILVQGWRGQEVVGLPGGPAGLEGVRRMCFFKSSCFFLTGLPGGSRDDEKVEVEGTLNLL